MVSKIVNFVSMIIAYTRKCLHRLRCILKHGAVKGRGHSDSDVVADKIHAAKSSHLLNLLGTGEGSFYYFLQSLFKETHYPPATDTEANGRAGRRIKGL